MARRPLLRLARIRRVFRDERGFSLTELLTSMVILSIVLGAIGGLFVSGASAQVDLNRRFEAQQNARLAVDRMRRELHCASVVAVTTAGTSPNQTQTALATLGTGCPFGSGSVAWCTVGSANRFQLYRQAGSTCGGAPPAIPIADYLTTGLAFTYAPQSVDSLAKLHLSFPVDREPADSRAAYRLEDDIVLRNSTRNAP